MNFEIDEAGRTPEGHQGCVNMFDMFNTLWADMRDDGVITGEEYAATNFPQCYLPYGGRVHGTLCQPGRAGPARGAWCSSMSRPGWSAARLQWHSGNTVTRPGLRTSPSRPCAPGARRSSPPGWRRPGPERSARQFSTGSTIPASYGCGLRPTDTRRTTFTATWWPRRRDFRRGPVQGRGTRVLRRRRDRFC